MPVIGNVLKRTGIAAFRHRSGQIRGAARRSGMRMLADDGWRLVRLGVTTPEEVLRVTKAQTDSEESGGNHAAEIIATAAG